jgi:3-oxoacyl-[acyl-carrier protein] reductase
VEVRRHADELAGIPAELISRFRLDRLPFQQIPERLTNLISLEGVRALVTGGGGIGLGQAICHRLAGEGASVAVFDFDSERASEVADDVRQRWGVDAIAVAGSVARWSDAHRAVSETVGALGGLDVLVNSAGGVFGRQFGPFARLSHQSVATLIERNVLGTIYCTRAALDWMVPAGRGRIINIASEGGKVGMRDIGLYNACKAAVIGLTSSLARELAGSGVSPVAVCPGVMMSAGLLRLLQKDGADAAAQSIESGFARSTIGRASLPEEVANVVAFLASEAGSYVHATAVSVGGGLSD